jgi:transposase
MGTTKRRNFAPEYKAAAVELLNEPGASYNSVSADLGITLTQLKTWHLEQAAAGSEAALARQKADAEELTRLRREVKRLSEENEILQKASAFFASKAGKT